jgi:hypothetical protein
MPPANPKPSIDGPYADETWSSHLTQWTPYPLRRDPIQLPLHSLYNHVCELYLLAADAQALVFADFTTMSPTQKLDAARKMDARFLRWNESLAPRFQFEDPNFLIVPMTLDLTYYTLS